MLTILVIRFLLANASLSFIDDVLVVGAALGAIVVAVVVVGLVSFFLPTSTSSAAALR